MYIFYMCYIQMNSLRLIYICLTGKTHIYFFSYLFINSVKIEEFYWFFLLIYIVIIF